MENFIPSTGTALFFGPVYRPALRVSHNKRNIEHSGYISESSGESYRSPQRCSVLKGHDDFEIISHIRLQAHYAGRRAQQPRNTGINSEILPDTLSSTSRVLQNESQAPSRNSTFFH